MRDFKLSEAENLEIELNLTHLKIPFLIKYDIDCDGNIDLLQVCTNKINLIEIVHNQMLNDIKKLIFRELQKQDEFDYINYMTA